MKVILLAATPPPMGGIATWTKRMLAMSKTGELEFELVNERLGKKREVFGDNIRRNFFDEIRRNHRIWHELKTACQEQNVGAVQSCIPAGTFSMLREIVCGKIAKYYKKKYIVHFHCTVSNSKDSIFWKWVLKKICNMADGIIVLNSMSMQYLNSFCTTPCYLIPNFVEKSEISEGKKINDVLKCILYVGGVIEEKGVLDIIAVAKDYPDIEFRLVGKASGRVLDLAKHNKNVTIVGELPHEQIENELDNADAFMFLSKFRGEGFSIALLEAMAAGLPCIVTDWAANRDMIGNNGGMVVTVGDASAASAAVEVLKDKETRKNMSISNMNKVKEHYSSFQVYDDFRKMYAEICKK